MKLASAFCAQLSVVRWLPHDGYSGILDRQLRSARYRAPRTPRVLSGAIALQWLARLSGGST